MDLRVRPRDTVSFEQFTANEPVSVALDGYVYGPSRWDRDGHFSFNHHDGVSRFTTRATCEQVALALRAGAPITGDVKVFVNDDDPDVALSVWLLDHPELVSDPAVMALCTLQGAVDTYGGASGVPTPAELEPLAWVIDPWATCRDCVRNAGEMADVIGQVGERISAHISGRGDTLAGDWGYRTVCARGKVWAVVEDHPLARAQVCAAGADVFVSIGDRDGHRTVTIGKASPFVDCDLVRVWDRLNLLDRCDDPSDQWGGGDGIGGSPRRTGTGLDAATIVQVVEDVIRAG